MLSDLILTRLFFLVKLKIPLCEGNAIRNQIPETHYSRASFGCLVSQHFIAVAGSYLSAYLPICHCYRADVTAAAVAAPTPTPSTKTRRQLREHQGPPKFGFKQWFPDSSRVSTLHISSPHFKTFPNNYLLNPFVILLYSIRIHDCSCVKSYTCTFPSWATYN